MIDRHCLTSLHLPLLAELPMLKREVHEVSIEGC